MGVAAGINVYDITRKCEGRLCYDFTDADDFLNKWVAGSCTGGPCRGPADCQCARLVHLARPPARPPMLDIPTTPRHGHTQAVHSQGAGRWGQGVGELHA